jgi:opacity protein-like surface antigen
VMVETGVLLGPAKASFLFAHLPGPDRRNGLLIDNQPFAEGTGYPVFIPYSFLLGYAYGAGIGAFDLNRRGYINAATVLAARLDYAVAANLNLYASFLWANRAGNGYGLGFIDLDDRRFFDDPTGANVGGVPLQVSNPNFGQTLYHNTDTLGGRRVNAISVDAPNIPHTNLGWEVTLGFDWKLLDGVIAGIRYAYWRPGKWFSGACIDKSVANRGAPDWGVKIDRVIDPVTAIQTNLTLFF